jgi:hypothetical protein
MVGALSSDTFDGDVLVELILPDGTELAVPAEVEAPAPTMPGQRRPPPLPPETRRAGPPPPPPIPVAAARAPEFAGEVAKALVDEAERRRGLTPHQQLGVALDAGDSEIAEAHRQLCERYAPTRFTRYGATTLAAARAIGAAIAEAHRQLVDPSRRRALIVAGLGPDATALEREQKRRGDEARATLRGSIERRLEEACARRDQGQLDEAIRGFEAVIALDRKHDYAQKELQALRAKQNARNLLRKR